MTTDSNTEKAGIVLITGANGHLGQRLIAHLGVEYQIRAVVRSEQARQQLMESVDTSSTEIVVLDYRDRPALIAAAAGCSYVVHLVGIIKESVTTSYRQAHEETTQSLIASAEANQLRRILYLSILGSEVGSSNECLASKGRAEQLLQQAKTSSLILRVPMVLGEGDFAVASLLRRAKAGVNLLFRGSSLEQPIYAGDVIKAIAAGISAVELDDVVLDLGGPESLSRKELIERAGKMLNKHPISVSLPLVVGMTLAFLLEKVSRNPSVTRDMLGVLDHDDDQDSTAACKRLGIELTPLDEMLQNCLKQA